jgi:hypothetical protein
VLHQQIVHGESELGRRELPLQARHVVAIDDGRDDGGIGAGPSDAVLFQRLHQRAFRVARRRLREVLLRNQAQQVQLLADAHFGQQLLLGQLLAPV